MAGDNEQEDTREADPNILAAFKDFLGSPSTDDAFTSILRDYSPRKKQITDPSGQVRVEEKPATGLRFGTFFKTVGLFFRKPRSTYHLLRFARNQEKHNNPAFQKALIGSDELGTFIQNTAHNLDKIPDVLQNFGVDLAAKGNALDKEGLESIQASLTSSDVIKGMQNIAGLSMEAEPNYIKITAKALKLVDTSPGIRNYFETKGEAIKKEISNYIKTTAETEKSDLEEWKTLDNKGKRKFLERKGYSNEDRDTILESGELPKSMGSMIADIGITVEDVDKMLDILPIAMKKTGAIGDIAEKVDEGDLVGKAQEIGTLFEGKRRNPQAIAQILEKLSEGDFLGVAEDSLKLMESAPEISDYLNNNKETFGKIALSALKDNPAFKGSGLSSDVVNIGPYFLDHTEKLLNVITSQKEGNFIDAGEEMLNLINGDDRIKEYFAKNSEGLKSFVIAIVKEELDDQFKELNEGGLPEHNRMAVALGKYGLGVEDVTALADIAPVLINKTEDFGVILEQFKEGEYEKLAMHALDMVGPGQEINSYISKNKHIFGKILENTLKENPIFADVKGNVVDILPILLQDPENLKTLVKQGMDGQVTKLPETVLSMLETNKDLQIYLQKNREVMHSVAVKLLGVENYNIPKEVADAVLDITTPQNITQMKKLIPLANEGKWDDLIIGVASMIENDIHFKRTLEDNKAGFSKLINTVIDHIPDKKTYLGEAKIGTIAANILTDPGSVRSVAEAWKKGYVAAATAGAVAVTKSLMNPEIRNGLIKQLSNWWNGPSADNQAIVNSMATALNARGRSSGEGKVKLSDFINEVFEEASKNIEDETIKHRITKRVDRGKLFQNTSISGKPDNMVNFANLNIDSNSFLNTKFSNVSFSNTDLKGIDFTGASFENVNFKGASMDAATFNSMRNEIVNRKISLEGVKLIGDFKGLDLSNIDFIKADLSQVTSFDASTISGARFYNAKYPNNPEIMADTFGFKQASFEDEYISTDEALNKRYEEFIASQITDGIAYKSANRDDDVMSKEGKSTLLAHIKDLSSDSSKLGDKLRDLASYSIEDLKGGNFPIDHGSFGNVSDYRDTFSHMLTDIYNYRHNPAKMEEALVADMIAEDVTKALFGEGDNRGQDGLKIKQSIMQSVEQYSKVNGISPRSILTSSNYGKVIEEIVADIYPRTLSTVAGRVTGSGGIQLGENTINEDLIKKFTDHLNIRTGIHEFTNKELDSIDKLAEKISDNVFGSNSKTNRESDFKSIKTTLENSLYDIKSEKPGIKLDKILTDNQSKLVGNYAKSGLAKEYYDNTKHFGRGLSDDVHLASFRTKIASHISKTLTKDLEAEVQNKGQLQDNIKSIKKSKIQKRSFKEMAESGKEASHSIGK